MNKLGETSPRVLRLPKSPKDTWGIAGGKCDFLDEWMATASLGKSWEPWEEQSLRHGYELRELSDCFLIEIDLPGMAAQDISIEIHEKQVTVLATKTGSSGESSLRDHYSYGGFARTFCLPGYFAAEAVEATLEDGLLSIAISKHAALNNRIPLTESSLLDLAPPAALGMRLSEDDMQ